jgi:hypothetical protein
MKINYDVQLLINLILKFKKIIKNKQFKSIRVNLSNQRNLIKKHKFPQDAWSRNKHYYLVFIISNSMHLLIVLFWGFFIYISIMFELIVSTYACKLMAMCIRYKLIHDLHWEMVVNHYLFKCSLTMSYK